jgi:VWFA-related protein
MFNHSRPVYLLLLALLAIGARGTVPLGGPLVVPLAAQDRPAAVFRSGTSLVSVDVVVRDEAGAVVKGLTTGDFTVLEDGKPQQIQTFTFQEITDRPIAAPATTGVLANVQDRLREEVQRAAGATAAPTAAAAPVSPDAFAGRRLLVLLFDISSMQPEDVQRAVDSANKYVDGAMGSADLVAVVTIGSTLTVLSDFSADREAVRTALNRLAYSDGTATPPVAASTVATDEVDTSASDVTTDDSGFDAFNNDVRLRALKTLADTLGPIEQKKAILYFSAGMQRSGEDNQIELRSAINAAVRGNVAIYPVDARGLQAVVPGGDASRASGRGVGLFSGQNVQRQFNDLNASQETLTTLAADTGGRAFTDSNDFGDAFARAQRDLSAYYLIGYSSSNAARDGRFRRIQVRVMRKGLRVEARSGYYGDRDFVHTNVRDREAQLDDQLAAAVSSTDMPVVVGTGWFRQSANSFYVPIALAVPGSAVPVGSSGKVTLDVRGVVRDEQGRSVGKIKETLDLPSTAGAKTLAGKQVLYQSGVTLPPGRFEVKVVVRENTNGTIGSFEAPVVVPQLRDAALKVSTVVLSTQLQPAPRPAPGNPLVREGIQLLPNLTRVVTRGQSAYFYFEVYDPALADAAPQMRTSLAFYRGNVKVFETPVVERSTIDDAARKAVLFQFQVPAASFTPGTYTCQINVIDAVAAKVAFPRLTFLVRDN